MDLEREQPWASGNPSSQWHKPASPSEDLSLTVCSVLEGPAPQTFTHPVAVSPYQHALTSPAPLREYDMTNTLTWRCNWHNGINIPPTHTPLGTALTQSNSSQMSMKSWLQGVGWRFEQQSENHTRHVIWWNKASIVYRMFLLRVTSKHNAQGASIIKECFFLNYLLDNQIKQEYTLGSEQPKSYPWLQHVPAMWPSASSESQLSHQWNETKSTSPHQVL